MKPVFISPEGVVLDHSKIPTPHQETGTTHEPIPLEELTRLATREAEKASTKGKS
jgi:hypothetical protein